MNRLPILLIFTLLVACGNASNNYQTSLPEHSVANQIIDRRTEIITTEYITVHRFAISNYNEIRDVNFWNADTQRGFYDFFFSNGDVKAALEFRNFMEELDREIVELTGGNEHSFSSVNPRPVLINPVMVLIDNPYFGWEYLNLQFLSAIKNERPDLLFKGNRTNGMGFWALYNHPPIVQAAIRGNTSIVSFFVENVANWQRIVNSSYSDWNIWYDLPDGGNLLSYVRGKHQGVYPLLVGQGLAEYINISGRSIFVGSSNGTNVWSEPNFNSEIIRRINSEEELVPIFLTAYRVSGYQWVNFETEDGVRGWAPLSSISFYTGK
jgi:hypothetical protein